MESRFSHMILNEIRLKPVVVVVAEKKANDASAGVEEED
jgi:hypothetical protein